MSWLATSVAAGGVLLGLIGAKLIDFAGGQRRRQSTDDSSDKAS
jgi:hypothetical protein